MAVVGISIVFYSTDDRILFTGLYKPLLMTIVLGGLHVVFKIINVKNELIETKNLAAMVYCFMS